MALFFVVALPVVIILIIGTTFGSMESFDVGVLDRDDTAASADLVADLDRGEAIGVERFDSLDALRREVRTGTLERRPRRPRRLRSRARPRATAPRSS